MEKEIKISSKNLNTLFSKFLTLFIMLTAIVTSITVFSLIYENKKHDLYQLRQRSINLKAHFYADNHLISDFFIYDLINSDFYESGKSERIVQHDSLFKFLNSEIQFITKKNHQINTESLKGTETLKNELKIYQNTVQAIVKNSLLRGFQDYGYEGKMREYAHILENFDDFDKSKVLTLRRHEKDYIIRIKREYTDLLLLKSKIYAQEIQNSNLPKAKIDTIVTTLNLYVENFNKMAELDSILGIKTFSGLTQKYMESKQNIQVSLDFIIYQMNKIIESSENRLRFLYILISALIIVITFVFGLYIIRYLTRPISNLTKNIKAFVDSDFNETQNFEYKTRTKEMVVLMESYFLMKSEILELLNHFQIKVKERTEEIESQKELIEQQKLRAEKINREMLASIKYAKKIQEAIMPDTELLNNSFSEHFVIYKPRDIVSGDFLWFKHIKTKKKSIKLLAIADCTGHGVPGALMSMLSTAYLNEIVLRKEIAHANEVLELLKNNITNYFHYDGLDLVFIVLNEVERTLEFSGANRNLYIKRKDEIIKLKGNRMPVGKFPTTKTFDCITIKYKNDDILFAFSDGITDQLSEEGKKYGSRKFLEKFETIDNLKDLEKDIENQFIAWKGNNTQTDDVLVFAAKLY